MRYSQAELMVVTAARRLRDGDRVFVGVGLPNSRRTWPNGRTPVI